MRIVLYWLCSLLLVGVLFPTGVYAQNMRSGSAVVLSRGEVIDDDFFAAGDSVTISGTVNGDVYVAGGNVLIDGLVNGDVLAAGGSITINGEVRDDIRVVGGQIIVSGRVGRNLTAGAGSLTLSRDAQVGGSVTMGTGQGVLAGLINGNLRVGAGQLLLSGQVARNVLVGSEDFTLSPDAQIAGNLEYYAGENIRIDNAASVGGEVKRNEMPRYERNRDAQRKAQGGFITGGKIVGLLMSLVVGLLLLHSFGKIVQRTSLYMRERPWVSLGVGFVSLFCVPVLFVLLLLTLFGIPLAMILLMFYILVLYLSHLFMSYFVGQFLMKYINRPWANWSVFVLGLVVFSLVTWIPVLGGIVSFVSLLFSAGGLFMTLRLVYFDGRKKLLF